MRKLIGVSASGTLLGISGPCLRYRAERGLIRIARLHARVIPERRGRVVLTAASPWCPRYLWRVWQAGPAPSGAACPPLPL